ncbi:hypothetical protein NIASO_11470 [Niabella soli DSM 19437]|uniref:Uncharacterized protein n=1 Tax=Niabella soli DSM 19437 TaxID=929713 RepID=W0F8E5_9BACT|nr:hypothetical protein NIASO_11470 [Niabella soli DSM 19437]
MLCFCGKQGNLFTWETKNISREIQSSLKITFRMRKQNKCKHCVDKVPAKILVICENVVGDRAGALRSVF